MTDTEQAAYDAANKEIERLKDELCYYKRLTFLWREVARKMMSIAETIGDDEE